jgi:hypothetical protein
MAVAISIAGFGVTEPAVAKVRKGCKNQQQQQHQVNQTGECNDIIIENLDPSSKGPFYRSNSQKTKKHARRTQ